MPDGVNTLGMLSEKYLPKPVYVPEEKLASKSSSYPDERAGRGVCIGSWGVRTFLRAVIIICSTALAVVQVPLTFIEPRILCIEKFSISALVR